MFRKFVLAKEGIWILKGIFAGVIFGGVVVVTIGTLRGGIIAMILGTITVLYTSRERVIGDKRSLDYPKLKLREEKLDIFKRRIQRGKVSIHKEVLREEKNVKVPVIREELVIEKKSADNECSIETDKCTETIRIPIREERVEIIKHPVFHGDVKVYRHQIKETRRIDELLKKEKIHIKSAGNTGILYKDGKK